MFGRSGATGIDGVQIHLQIIGNVPADHRALQEMDVFQPVDDPGGIMQVLHGAFAIFAALDIDKVYRSPRRAVMHPRA